jgi:hypothetical protein
LNENNFPRWDVNIDGVVNILDVVLIGLHWGETGTTGGWIAEDVYEDKAVNILDVVVVGLHWGETS